VEKEVRKRIAEFAPGGGFVFNQIHNIQPQGPPENIVRMFETALKCGTYPIRA
jgi:uroporphyrinogen decarboxylase